MARELPWIETVARKASERKSDTNFTCIFDKLVVRQNLIVVGNGMTSQSFCRWLTDCPETRDRYSITVFGEEPHLAYDRVHLTSLFGEKSALDLQLAPEGWYSDRGISIHVGETVTSVDRSHCVVSTSKGRKFEYDKLVLAVGSRPFVPPVDGVDLPGVFVYRTIDDVREISSYGNGCDSAAVMGGGLLGLEAAKALHDLQVVPHVVEMAPTLMPRQLDRRSAHVLKTRVERMGVKVHLTKRTKAIEKHGDFLIVKFDTGESLSVKMVVISAGVRPRDDLARSMGLKIGARGGIEVDDHLQTSDPNIFSIGECVIHRGVVYGLVGPCFEMAKVLAERFQGIESTFESGDRSAQLKLLGVDVVAFGEPIGDSPDTTAVTAPAAAGCRTVLLRNKRIVGAIGVGKWPEAPRIRAAISSNKRLRSWEINRFLKTGQFWHEATSNDVANWPPAAVVCSCKSVTLSELTTACQNGCRSIEQLRDRTGASSVCGSCRPLLATLVGNADSALEQVAGWRGLLIASSVAIAVVVSLWLTGPVDFASSVASSRREIDYFWRDDFWKQLTGYVLLAITLVTLLLSIRKRVNRFSLGQFATWRMIHAYLGCLTLIGVLAHTGWHMGHNLNRWLMTCFLGVNLVGAVTGIVSSLESRASGGAAIAIRQWKPRFAFMHILFFWPLPLLIAAHVFSIYFY